MFGLFKKDEGKKLQKEYERIMQKAVDAQRNGNIALYAKLSTEADEIAKKLDKIEQANS
jgi:hypothetical protein